MHFFNIHTHFPTFHAEVLEVENRYYCQAGAPRARHTSVGLHPWYLRGIDLDTAERWMRTEVEKGGVAAIGEAGFDRLSDVPLTLQADAFECCVALSEALRLPLLIHCVGAYDLVLETKKRLQPAQCWILHGFDKHPQTARSLLDAGFYLSFGAALLRERSHAGTALRQTPAERFFLETDDKQVDIRAIYERAAVWRTETPELLEKQLRENVASVFGTRIFAP